MCGLIPALVGGLFGKGGGRTAATAAISPIGALGMALAKRKRDPMVAKPTPTPMGIAPSSPINTVL